MWLHMALAGLLVVGTHTFAPAPLQLGTQTYATAPLQLGIPTHAAAPLEWAGSPGVRFILAPRALPEGALVAPEQLMIRDRFGKLFPNDVPQFTLKADKTLSWDGMGLCIEASGNENGNAVWVSRCTGEPGQLWDVLHLGKNQMQVQLENTDKCMSINVNYKDGGLNRAPVELRECAEKAIGLWTFGEPILHPAQAPVRLTTSLLCWRHAAMSFNALALVGALTLIVWSWRRQRLRPITVTKSQGRFPLKCDQGGISLEVPPAVSQPCPVDIVLSPMASEDHVTMFAAILEDALLRTASVTCLPVTVSDPLRHAYRGSPRRIRADRKQFKVIKKHDGSCGQAFRSSHTSCKLRHRSRADLQMMARITVRQALPADSGGKVSRLVTEGIMSPKDAAAVRVGASEILKDMKQRFSGRNSRDNALFVAEDDDDSKIVGCVGVDVQLITPKAIKEDRLDPELVGRDPKLEDRPVLSNLSVRREYRKRGIAQRLCNAAEQKARQWGYKEILLRVESDNIRARKLYRKLGYRVVTQDEAEKPEIVNSGLKWVQTTQTVMRKDLVFPPLDTVVALLTSASVAGYIGSNYPGEMQDVLAALQSGRVEEATQILLTVLAAVIAHNP